MSDETPSNENEDEEGSPLSRQNVYADECSTNYYDTNTLIEHVKETNTTSTRTKLYTRRWYILFVVMLVEIANSTIWGTFGPITQSVKKAYGWSETTVTVVLNFGNIGIILGLGFAGYMTRRMGLKAVVLTGAFLVAAGAGLRIITMDETMATMCFQHRIGADLGLHYSKCPKVPFRVTLAIYIISLIGAGQFINGLGGSIMAVIPTAVSETWFPSNERTTATAAAMLSGLFGSAINFVVGPNMVIQPPGDTNETILGNTTESFDYAKMKDQLYLFLVIEFAIGGVSLLITAIYFPSKPPLPPTLSATVQRHDFWGSLAALLRKFQIWQLAILAYIPQSIFGIWLALLDIHLHRVGISQTDAGWIGLISSLIGAIGGTLIGRLADCFKRHLKWLATSTYVVGLLSIVWTMLMMMAVLPHTKVLFGISLTILNLAFCAAPPMVYELTCEAGFPAAEEVVSMVIGFGINLTGIVYLLIQLIPNIGTLWMTWAFCGTQALAIPLIVMFKESYRRVALDETGS